jgi:RNA polymerase sigma factor (TIGR02999 family)
MRQILVDYARARARLKRGGGRAAVTFQDATYAPLDPVREPETFIALDEALTRLQKTQPRLGQVVELRFFAGMSLAEIGEVLEIHERTVERDWRRARAYLFRLLSPD